MSTALEPRGPKGHFVRGNLPEYVRNPLSFLKQATRQYGDVVRLRFFHIPVLILNNPEHIEALLVTNNKQFIKPVDFRLPFFRGIFGNGLLTSEGDFWLRQRRLAQPAFHRARIAEYGRVMVAYTGQMLSTWRDGETRDVHQEMMVLTLKIAIKTLFNVEAEQDVGLMSTLSNELIEMFSLKESPLWLAHNFLPTRSNRRFRRMIGKLDEYIYAIIRKRRNDAEDAGDLLSMLLRAQDEDGSRMTDKQVRDEVTTLFLAGHETTALALSWTWCMLSEHGEAEEKLMAELDLALEGRIPRVEDLPRLTYAEAIVKETMRLFPPAWAFGRQAVEDCELAGQKVPKGRQVYVFPWITHRDPRFFEEPESFRPERWLGDAAKRIPKYAYFPFSAGPRACIGNTFAMMESVLALAAVAQKFRLRLAKGQTIEPWPVFTLRPRYGIKMILEEREPRPASLSAH